MRIKFLSLLLLATVISLAPSMIHAEDYDPSNTILAINMAAVSINRILSTEDRIVLDQEYETIMNNLSLSNIKSDSDITALYLKVMDTISRKRLRAEETDFLQQRYDDEMRGRLAHAVSSGSSVMKAALTGGERFGREQITSALSQPKNMLLTFLGGISGNKIREGMNQDLWRLRTADLSDINEIQKQLLASSWNLMNKYSLPENSRLVENSIKDFYKTINVPDNSACLRMLRELEGDFRSYPPYWYYRAKSAREAGDSEEYRKCLDEFAGVWRPVMRQDPYMLEVSKYRVIDILSVEGAEISRDEAVKYLDVAKSHTPRSDWADNLFIGTVYFALGEKEKGISCVRVNIDFGHEREISGAILRQMGSGSLKPDELSEELTAILSNNKGSVDVTPLAVIAKISGDTGIETLRRGFMSLHSAEWDATKLGEKLSKVVDDEFEENTKSLKWGTRGFQLAVNRNGILGEIQQDIIADFRPEYQAFMRNLQEKYFAVLQADTSRLLREAGERDYVFRVNPMVQARILSGSIENEREGSLIASIWERIGGSFSSAWSIVTWLTVGLLIITIGLIVAKKVFPVWEYSGEYRDETSTINEVMSAVELQPERLSDQ